MNAYGSYLDGRGKGEGDYVNLFDSFAIESARVLHLPVKLKSIQNPYIKFATAFSSRMYHLT